MNLEEDPEKRLKKRIIFTDDTIYPKWKKLYEAYARTKLETADKSGQKLYDHLLLLAESDRFIEKLDHAWAQRTVQTDKAKEAEDFWLKLDEAHQREIRVRRNQIESQVQQFKATGKETAFNAFLRYSTIMSEAKVVAAHINEAQFVRYFFGGLTQEQAYQISAMIPIGQEEKWDAVVTAVGQSEARRSLFFGDPEKGRETNGRDLQNPSYPTETLALVRSKWTASKPNNANANCNNKQNADCWFCGDKRHPQGTTCPARSKDCDYCGKRGHMAKVCRKKIQDDAEKPTTKANEQSNYMHAGRRSLAEDDLELLG